MNTETTKINIGEIDVLQTIELAKLGEQNFITIINHIDNHNKMVRRNEMYEAYRKLQRECSNITKNVEEQFKYANLAHMLNNTKEKIAEHGFFVECTQIHDNYSQDHCFMQMKLVYKNGEYITCSGKFPLDKSDKTNIQTMGSTITYARRYLLGMILNITTTDDDRDGNNTIVFSGATKAQLETMNNLISEMQIEVSKVLEYVGAESLDKMTMKQASKAINALVSKKNAIKNNQ